MKIDKDFIPQYCFECGSPLPIDEFKFSLLHGDDENICLTCGVDFDTCYFCKKIYDYRILHLMNDKINYICVYCIEERK